MITFWASFSAFETVFATNPPALFAFLASAVNNK